MPTDHNVERRMESGSVPCGAPDKGIDVLRVTSSTRNARLALQGVQMPHRDPRSQGETFPRWAAESTGPILLLVPCGMVGLGSALQVWVAVALQLTPLFLSAARTVSVRLSICGFSLQQDSTGTGAGGRSPRQRWEAGV